MQFTDRDLPHFTAIGMPLFVTFRLYGSLPTGRSFHGGSLDSGKAFVAMERLLEEPRIGPVYLRIPEIAQLVADVMRKRTESDYRWHA